VGREPSERPNGRIEELKDFDLGEYKLLSRLLLVSIAAAIALLLSASCSCVNLTAATVISSTFAIVVTTVDALLVKYIRMYRGGTAG